MDFEGINFKWKFLMGFEFDVINVFIGFICIDFLGILFDFLDCEGWFFFIGY